MSNDTTRDPAHSLQSPVPTSAANGGTPDGSGASACRILVIDDDAEVREIIAVMLTKVGFRVDTAGDGAAGWVALRRSAYDLVITDHMMPKVTGLELVRRLRDVTMDLPCILISGELPWHESDLPTLLQPGAAMEKPFGLGDLLAKVRELLARSSTRRSAALAGSCGRSGAKPGPAAVGTTIDFGTSSAWNRGQPFADAAARESVGLAWGLLGGAFGSNSPAPAGD